MNSSYTEYCERLGINPPESFFGFYKKGEKLYKKCGKSAVDSGKIDSLQKRFGMFGKWFDDVQNAAKIISEDEDLLLFVYIFGCILEERHELCSMTLPDRECAATDHLPLFSFLRFADEMAENLEKRKLPEDVIRSTMSCFGDEMNDYHGLFGRSGVRIYSSWFMHFLNGDIIRIGRLNFEMSKFSQHMRVYDCGGELKVLADGEYMHKSGMVWGSAGQTDEEGKYFAEITEENGAVSGYAANEYGEIEPHRITLEGAREVLRRGDKILSVHIPAEDPLTVELCEEAYKRAREIFASCYPEFGFKAFCCFSWMLEKRLRLITGKESNITRFADKYTGFPLLSGDACFSFLFHVYDDKPELKNLPETTSMQRAVKKYLCEGGHFYAKGGVFLP